MKKTGYLLAMLALVAMTTGAKGQGQQDRGFRVMWYNVENLFDTVDAQGRNDGAFLPLGKMQWNGKRYDDKLKKVAQVVIAAGEWGDVALIGFCEVEGEGVLRDLTLSPPLQNAGYGFCCAHSADVRGIEVGLLYKRSAFRLISSESHKIARPTTRKRPTRDILHACGVVRSGDTLDVFLCHFPSRVGGQERSMGYRMAAAIRLRGLCDSVYALRAKPSLLVMGDFNDEAQDASLSDGLGVRIYPPKAKKAGTNKPVLFDLFGGGVRQRFAGSYYYRSKWYQLDHIIVSQELLDTVRSPHVAEGSIRLFAPDFLLSPDRKGRNLHPRRTYSGTHYDGGFSDHLPLTVDLLFNE